MKALSSPLFDFLSLRERHLLFWRNAPALLASLFFLVLLSFRFFSLSPFILILFLFYLLWLKKWVFFSIFLILGLIPKPVQFLDKQKVEGVFTPKTVHFTQSFKPGFLYRGDFTTKEGVAPIWFVINKDLKERPLANQKYKVQGEISSKNTFSARLKPTSFSPIKNSISLAEFRFSMKRKLQKLLDQKMKTKKMRTFINALLTGDLEDKLLRFEFGKLGMQHILAISGFHFGIITTLFSFTFSLFLSRFGKIAALFFILSLYSLFIGPSPSVERSYITAIFYLLGSLLNRNVSPLNLLGVALFTELFFNPLIIQSIGFQLSFLSCLSILIFYSPIEEALKKILPKRSLHEAENLSLLALHGYFLSAYLRKAISLNFSVSLLLTPLLLYHFHELSLLGFFYNLFIPTFILIIFSLSFLSLAFLLLFPPLANLFFSLLNFVTDFTLTLIEYPPSSIQTSLKIGSISEVGALTYIAIALFFHISYCKKNS